MKKVKGSEAKRMDWLEGSEVKRMDWFEGSEMRKGQIEFILMLGYRERWRLCVCVSVCLKT